MIIAVSGVKATTYDVTTFKVTYKVNKAVAVIKKYCVFTHIYFTVSFDFSSVMVFAKFHKTAPFMKYNFLCRVNTF